MFDFLKSKKKPEPKLEVQSTGVVDCAVLPEILRFFPIGDKVQYFPEFNHDELFDSIIIGYEINRMFIYAMADFSLDEFEQREVNIYEPDGQIKIVRIESFGILIPDHRRTPLQVGLRASKSVASLVDEESRDFRTGNNITLVSMHPGRGAPQLDNTVARTLMLKKGYYANNSVVMLRPVYDSLVQIDRRNHQRIETSLPVEIKLPTEEASYACSIVDVGEGSMRIDTYLSPGLITRLKMDDRLAIKLTLEDPDREFQLQAQVLKMMDHCIVVQLKMTDKYGRFVNLGLIDMLDVKSTILQQPQSRK